MHAKYHHVANDIRCLKPANQVVSTADVVNQQGESMDEILKKLLENELLSEETKAQISEQWTTSVEAFKTQVREEVSMVVRSELAEQWIAERDELVTKVDGFVTEALIKEITELKGDIERFRDLEAEYAEKLVEEKHKLAEEVASELDALVDKIDAFFEVRLSAELDELKEDLQVVKQNEFGRRIYEAFATTFAVAHVDEDSVTTQLRIAEAKLADANKALNESEEHRNQMVREAKLEKLLAPLTGKKREQMEMVLKNIETARLEESYKFFIGRILKEEVEAPAKTLTEGAAGEKKTTVVTGDTAPVTAPTTQLDEGLARMKRLAGVGVK
jgi:hypothetical protein